MLFPVGRRKILNIFLQESSLTSCNVIVSLNLSNHIIFYSVVIQNEPLQAPVVKKLVSAIHWINRYPVDNTIGFANAYPLDSYLSSVNTIGFANAYPLDSYLSSG